MAAASAQTWDEKHEVNNHGADNIVNGDLHYQQERSEHSSPHDAPEVYDGKNGGDVSAPTTTAQPTDADNEKLQRKDSSDGHHLKETLRQDKGPAGGFDKTPIPKRPNGYTIKITIHRAENLPMADINGFSSDPYCITQINTDTPRRHKEDPKLRWRTPTIRKSTEPTWDDEWIVANVPASGCKLKVRIYDEDPADADDLLGRAHISIPELYEGWGGIRNRGFKLLAYGGSNRAYLLQAVTTCFRENKHFRGYLYLSVEMLGRTKADGQNGRLYTVGPCRWVRHYSPMLGRIVNIKEPDQADDDRGRTQSRQGNGQKKKSEQYNFRANQFQLQGPVPAELYHRFVEFKPWVGRMFTSKGISGVLMGKALHHQHTRVYNFGRSTVWGHLPQGPCEEMTRKFLDLVHYDQGGRIFTYVLTLDALWRFTETGKEFGIDMLSKHTMHSDVSIYIAFSGEFFIRRLKHPRSPPPPDPAESSSQAHPPTREENPEHPPQDIGDGPPDSDPPKHPNHYELVIDNDSGTYRPNADMLPLLKKFLAHNLPGLHILVLDCNKDAEKQQRMKKEQREKKKKEGDQIIYTQGSRDSSVSSSDEEDLDRIQADLIDEDAVAHEHGAFSQAAKDAKLKNQAKLQKFKNTYGGVKREGVDLNEDETPADALKGQGPLGAGDHH
ncbi:hypothetical protein CLAFUW4_10456 [Fulvia fulva]|uniref:C2 domain-containing protein n=1 Tax=Passalora fulva TaxID=5499 RepID=A0A9Q8LFU4_PASFU|nr:uncharacterized protein CLAFUR5_05072 [Fulvia fulva]KAK4615710.1 hypothetical protein CLAFUR4_10460 [Fulvia fulva]KAK4616781.1 hypothetical protein CLAFUR0_10461 [Fulvia fulva]UJO16615.1 hypothetical protein CLAFUR5_05072 [Fulvia fulva]WPV19594.1 hypothetical protein CLAFUW4_10456 [Fulvia fulva]WPV34611.1 hypothetical protein CLAFUW7_10456 [Fulvia fulva]